jgi:hypothetical protein
LLVDARLRIRSDPDPYKFITDPDTDPGGLKTYGFYGSGTLLAHLSILPYSVSVVIVHNFSFEFPLPIVIIKPLPALGHIGFFENMKGTQVNIGIFFT